VLAVQTAAEFRESFQHVGSPASDPDVQAVVSDIQSQVLQRGDAALHDYARRFDRVSAPGFKLVVTSDEIESATTRVPREFMAALTIAHRNISDYHRHQLPTSWRKQPRAGVDYGLQYRALDSVGLYVPGGRAIYPSSVLMNAIPARIAGVDHIVMATPPQADGQIPDAILAAASVCGVSTVIKSGGAQAIFAMAYGTESVPKVDKIVGPGNKYVDGAKQRVYGVVDIDKPAGPSEVAILVTDARYARFAAAEMLAQLEHDPDARAVSVTPSAVCATAIVEAFREVINHCKRRDIIAQSVCHSSVVVTDTLADAIEMINTVASEHLVLLVDDADTLLPNIRHAGSIFLGPFTPVALGDYIAGPNHVLPTASAARFSSPLGVMDFMKYSAICRYSEQALSDVANDMRPLTTMEGFDAHQLSVDIRLQSTPI